MPLHPVVATIVERMKVMPAFSECSPSEARAMVAAGRAGIGNGPEMVSVVDVEVEARGGNVRTRVFQPSERPKGVIVFYHGGGWVVGAIEDFDTYARSIAVSADCTVVLPDYRLAPENPFPAGLEDAEDVLIWVASHKAELGVSDDASIIVAGDSAGGNLATVVARRMGKSVRLAAQVLYYPVTDCDFVNDSYREHGTGLPLKASDMEWFFSHYAPRAVWGSPDISPLRSHDLVNMPPAIIVTAEYDVLRDEGKAYAQKLRDAGVVVTERCAEGLTHGFIRLHNICEPAGNELERIGRDISEFLG